MVYEQFQDEVFPGVLWEGDGLQPMIALTDNSSGIQQGQKAAHC